MSCRLVFRCEFCGCRPDPETQQELERGLSLLMFGTYVDVEPANWLTWHGRGVYGPTRYACHEHREALQTHLRKHYGTLGPHPHAEGPYPAGWLRRETSAQTRRRRQLMTYRSWSSSDRSRAS